VLSLAGKAMLNIHIEVKSIEDILSEQQTNQEPDEEEDKHEEAVTQMPTYNKAIEHLNALQCLWRASQRCLRKYGKPFGTWRKKLSKNLLEK
jgi:hypothetical protein